jgi:lipopolysaccharide exporter
LPEGERGAVADAALAGLGGATDLMMVGVDRKVAIGVAWMGSARAIVRVLGFLSTLLLARLLTPADFGLVAMAMVVASGLELLTLFNFDMALVQTVHVTRAHYDSAWTLNVLMGVALALALALLAVPVAAFYREPRLQAVMLLIALKYLVDSAGNPGTVDFRRSLDFRPDFFMQVGPKIAGVLATVPLALWLRDYRALLAGMLLTSGVTCLLSYVLHPHRPRWCLVEASGMVRFSRWLLLNNVMGFLRTRSADLIIGRTFGSAALGTFSVAYEVSNLPSTEMVAPINRVLFPSYVHVAKDPERLRDAFRATLGLITLFVLPVCIGVAALADPLVRVVLGEKWLDTIPLIAILAVAGAPIVLQATTGSVYNALGLPRMIALTGGIHAATLVPMLLVATSAFGLIGAAWAMLIHSFALGIVATYWLFLRTTPIRLTDVAQVCWRPITGCAAMFGALRLGSDAFGPFHGFAASLVGLGVGCAIGALTYLAVVYCLWTMDKRPEGAEAVVFRHVAGRLVPWRGSGKRAAPGRPVAADDQPATAAETDAAAVVSDPKEKSMHTKTAGGPANREDT